MAWYGPETPLTPEREHRGRTGDGPRTFEDAARGAASALTSYEEAQARTEGAQIGLTEMVVLFDDEVGAGPVVESGGPATGVRLMSGSGDEGSSGTLEVVDWGLGGHTEVTVAVKADGFQIIREFLPSVMVVPDSGLTPDVPGLIGQLRAELQDVTVRVCRGERGAEAALLGTNGESVEHQWFTEERAWFGLEKMNVVHRFLSYVVRPPSGGFSLYLAGIRHKLVAQVRCLERDAARGLRLES